VSERADVVVVLGADALGLALAADLALAGREVVLYETSEREALIAPIRERRRITVQRAGRAEVATLAVVTDDPFAALGAGDVLLATVPPDAQAAFAEFLLPLVEPRHLLVLCRGGLGSLAMARWLLLRGRQPGGLATFAETDLPPFVCRRTGPDTVAVHGAPSRIGLGVLPAVRTVAALRRLGETLPGVWAYPNVAAAGLGAVGDLVRAVTMVLNVGRGALREGEFLLYDEGLTPGAAAVTEALDAERRRIAAALGSAQRPIAQALAAAG
jgi:opine dehydrogenase